MQKQILLSLALISTLSAEQMQQNQTHSKILEEVTVTAQRSAQSTDEISKSISVINSKDIEQKIGKATPHLISQAPGVSIVNEGMDSGTINMRGFSSSDYRVPMFVDGLRFRGRPVFEYSIFSPDQI